MLSGGAVSIITLTTDFGAGSPYVAAMKGVILERNPGAVLVDISHSVHPQNVLQAAFVIDAVYEYFPPGTVHLVVVDPGVGTGRRAVAARTGRALFVAPDNGVLSYVVGRFLSFRQQDPGWPFEAGLPAEVEAVHLTRPEFWLQPVSRTFHGRDIFAPVAAGLSLGRPLDDFGERTGTLTVLPPPLPRVSPDGSLTGHVLFVDSFGNLITDVKHDDVVGWERTAEVRIGDHVIHGLVSAYAEGGGLTALFGSSGRLEIALRNGNAAEFLQAGAGHEINVRPAGRPSVPGTEVESGGR